MNRSCGRDKSRPPPRGGYVERTNRQGETDEPVAASVWEQAPPCGPSVSARRAAPSDASKGMNAAERDSFLKIVEGSTLVARHEDLYTWLQGPIQRFIPHQILICAHGYFDTWQLKLDVISTLSGVRSQVLARCEIDVLLKGLFNRWIENERNAFVLHSLEGLGLEESRCRCPLHAALRRTRAVLIHGVHDERGECDSLYIAINSDALAKGCFSECFRQGPCFLVDALIGQIDMCSRKLASLPGSVTIPAAFREGGPRGLTSREREILDWIYKGKTNEEIGFLLDISCFTVKNHIQRIFQKIGAGNRVQAVTLYRAQLGGPSGTWRR